MSSNVVQLNRTNFRDVVESSGSRVLVDFWAPWCGPCRAIAPELEAVASELKDKITVAKVNVDEEPELAEHFGVQSIPNLILFSEGKPVRQMVGFVDRRA